MSAPCLAPTHCPKCGKRGASSMLACPATNYEVGYHHLPEYARNNALGPVVAPKMLFDALDEAYLAMSVARARSSHKAVPVLTEGRWKAAQGRAA